MARQALIAVLICLGVLLTACGEDRERARPGDSPPAATRVLRYVPAVPTARRVGSCWTSSTIVPRADVWRCRVDHNIFDPCFTATDGETVVCGSEPGSNAPGFGLRLAEALPAPDLPPATRATAYLIELEDGTTCRSATPLDSEFEMLAVSFVCDRGPGGERLVIGELLTGSVWMAEVALIERSAEGLTIQRSETVPIGTVWQ